MPFPRSALLTFVLLFLVGLLFGGCGGDDSGPDPSAGGPGSATASAPPLPPDLASVYPTAFPERLSGRSTVGPVAASGLPTANLVLDPGWNLLSAPVVNVEDVTGLPSPLFAYEDGVYTPVTPDALEPSRSFWVYSPSGGQAVFSGDPVAEAAGVATRLARGWNLVGFTSSAPVPFATMSVSVAGVVQPLADVVTQDPGGAGGAALFRSLFPYGDGSYQAVDVLAQGAVATPGTGYWLYCLRDDVTLLYRTPGEVATVMPGPGAGLAAEAATTVFVQADKGATIQVGGATVGIPAGALAADGDVTVSVFPQARIVPYNSEFIPVGKSVEFSSVQDLVGDVNVSFPDTVSSHLAAVTTNQGDSAILPSVGPVPNAYRHRQALLADVSSGRVGADWEPVDKVKSWVRGKVRGVQDAVTDWWKFTFRPDPKFETVGDAGPWGDPSVTGRFAVVIHGINQDETGVDALVNRLAAQPSPYVGVAWLRYDYTAGAGAAAGYLRDELQRLGALRSGVELELYGYSFGGIVARSFIQQYDGSNGNPFVSRKLFTIFTPHRGSRLTLKWSLADVLNSDALNCLDNSEDPGPLTLRWWPLDRTIDEMKFDNQFLRDLNVNWEEEFSEIPVRAIAGCRYPLDGNLSEDSYDSFLNPLYLGVYKQANPPEACDGVVGVPSAAPRLAYLDPKSQATKDPRLHHFHQEESPVLDAAMSWAVVPPPETITQTPGTLPPSDPEQPPQVAPDPAPAPSPSPEPPRDDASFVGWPFRSDSPAEQQPGRRDVGLGDTFWIDIAARNTGNTTWRASAGYALVNDLAADGLSDAPARIPVDRDVAPGDVFLHRFTLNAPRTPVAGPVRTTYRMEKSGTEFGSYQDWDVYTAGASVTFLMTDDPNGSDAPETMAPRTVRAGEAFTLTVHVKNTSRSTLQANGGWKLWNDFASDSYKDARTGEPIPSEVSLDVDVPPGQKWSRTFHLRSPGQNGQHQLTLRFYQEGGAAEDYLNVPVTVEGQYVGFEDQYLAGDWKPDGQFGGSNIAVRRGCQVLMDYSFDTSHDRDLVYGCGEHNDQYLAGDWDGDGESDIAVRRGGIIYMDTGKSFPYGNGNLEDEYLVGDYNGDHKDEIWIRRGCQFLVDTAQDGGREELSFPFGCGETNDQFLVGNWDGQGGDDIAVRRGQTIIYSTRPQHQIYGMGPKEDQYLVGDWNGDGIDNIAVRRGCEILMDTNFDTSHDLRQIFGHGTAPVIASNLDSRTPTAPVLATVPPERRNPPWRAAVSLLPVLGLPIPGSTGWRTLVPALDLGRLRALRRDFGPEAAAG